MLKLIRRLTEFEVTLGRVTRELHRERIKLRDKFDDQEPIMVEANEDLDNVKQMQQILNLILNILKFFS